MATLSFESSSTIMIGHLKGFKFHGRGVVILCFMALLLAAQVPLGNREWLEVYGMLHNCFWQRTSANYSPDNASMLVRIFWLF
jgi:hypothetical protein